MQQSPPKPAMKPTLPRRILSTLSKGFGHKPSCIGIKMSFAPTLPLVSVKWICFGRDITLFKTSNAPVRSAWALMNCTVCGGQSHCLVLDSMAASGLSPCVWNLLFFERWRRTKSWCPCACEGHDFLLPSFQPSMDTPGEPLFPGASRSPCSVSPSQKSLVYLCPSV